MTRRGGIIKMEEDGVENVWAKTPSRHAFSKYFLYCHIISFFPFPFPFLNNPGNDSLWFPFLKCGNGFCSFPSCSRNLGWDFFIPFPFPNFGNVFFSFPSRSRIEGMGFFNSLPVPELREWNYPFPFPFSNSQMSFPLTPEAASTLNKWRWRAINDRWFNSFVPGQRSPIPWLSASGRWGALD